MARLYDASAKRLIYLDRSATPDFWDSNWQNQMLDRDSLLSYSDSQWARITQEFLKPTDGPILEGGCGPGVHVAALRNLGYVAVGVDFASNTVNELNRVVPELDVRLGDVRKLNFDDNSFAGYWSLGVIEHFWNGYEEIAREMYRVLRPGGVLFLAFPYMNTVRTWKSRLRMFPQWHGEAPEGFYQFALNPRTVLKDFGRLGFSLIDSRPVLGRQGLEEEAPQVSSRMQSIVQCKSQDLPYRIWRRMVHEINSRVQSLCCYSLLLILRK